MGFLQDYFINPILANGWFNPVNTTVYSLILVVAVYYVYRMLARLRIGIDLRFGLAILPFIFWGSSTRVLHDAAYVGKLSPGLNEFYNLPVFPTPGSYFITFSLALAVLFASLLIQKRFSFPYWKAMLLAGIALDIANLLILPFENAFPFFLIAGGALAWFLVFHAPRSLAELLFPGRRIQRFLSGLLSDENLAIISAHFLDATATVAALAYFGYVEQHVVPRLLFPYLGPYAMFLLKAVVVPPVLWVLDRHAEDRNFRNFLKIVVLILGLAPGLRNMLRLMAGV